MLVPRRVLPWRVPALLPLQNQGPLRPAWWPLQVWMLLVWESETWPEMALLGSGCDSWGVIPV